MGSEESSSSSSQQKKIYWRSASWSSSRSDGGSLLPDSSRPPSNGGHHHRSGIPTAPLTPRSKTRSSLLPPLQPLFIARRSLDEWPKPGSDDLGEWPHNPPTPSSSSSAAPSFEINSSKNQIALFDKECSKVADHVYLGGDSVARNRDILRRHGITHVLNCVGFACPEYFKSDLVYKTLWLQDSPSEDITSILYDVFDYFEDVRGQQGARVLVHCCQGVSRSTSLVIAYLMWREGQSFDDAFQLVKAARGIANPNMGFACQLLQCQKRVHAVPLSPNSAVLRMYRMAPHSPYDPLHLVPKMLAEPSPGALDSRGAFIVHVVSAIFVWVGKGCDPVMEKDARAAAFQVVRYERVPGPVIPVEEGDEPTEFWDAFSIPAVVGGGGGSDKARKVGPVGKKRVESYNADFELFYKVITGGVVPPFPSSGSGQETCLPARESNWSILRRKFISGAMCRVFSESLPARDQVQVLAADAATLPPFPSPSSLSSESSIGSKSCSDSPSISPSTCSSPSLSDPLSFSSRPSLEISNNLEPLKPCLQAACLPTKGLASSIVERRNSFSLNLPLSKDAKDAVLLPNVSPNSVESKVEVLDESNNTNPYTYQIEALDNVNSVRQVRDMESLSRSAADSLDNAQSLPNSTQSVEIDLHTQTSIYRWPDMEKLTKFSGEDLDSKSVLFLLTPKSGRGEELDMLLYILIGSRFELVNKQSQGKSHKDVDGATEIDWSQIGCDFLARMDLPNDFPVKVVKEEEREELLELLKLN